MAGKELDGVVVGCDQSLEWLLPWWWMTYSLHNTVPVTFVDMGGMSERVKKWCRLRGRVVTLKMPKAFVLKEVDPKVIHMWDIDPDHDPISSFREIYYKKPFAMLLSPYDRTVWFDLDVHVYKPMEEMFPYCENKGGISITREPKHLQEITHLRKQLPPGELMYNSGVVVYKKDSKLLQLWIEEILQHNDKYLADQVCLSHLLATSGIPFTPLCPRYNWFLEKRNQATEPVNFHYTGSYKECIRSQMAEMSKTFYFNFTV